MFADRGQAVRRFDSEGPDDLGQDGRRLVFGAAFPLQGRTGFRAPFKLPGAALVWHQSRCPWSTLLARPAGRMAAGAGWGSIVQLNDGDEGGVRSDHPAGVLPACPGGDHQGAAWPEAARLAVVGPNLDLSGQTEEELTAYP